MTLDDIEAIDKDFLTPADVALYLHMTPHYIRIAAKKNSEKLLFPVIVSGNRTKTPKTLFVQTFRGRVE